MTDNASVTSAQPWDDSYRFIESVADYAIFRLDPGGHVASWNLGAERIKGYTAEEIFGAHYSRFFLPEDVVAGKPERVLTQARERGRAEDEGWRLRKDGTRFWASAVITALRNDQGELRGFAKVTRDLTERRQAEENARQLLLEQAARAAAQEAEQKLRASEERYHFLAEIIPVHIWTALPDGRLDTVTRQTARSFGLLPEQLLADGWQLVVHPDDLPLAVERWGRALSTGETYEVEFRLKMADGAYAAHLARAVPQRDAQKRILRWFGTNTNIDAQREEQRRIQALLAEVVTQASESEATVLQLRSEKEQALQRIAQLEEELRRR